MMHFVRVSWMEPKAGRENDLVGILNKLSEFYRSQPGYIEGFVLSPYEGAQSHKRYGRVGVWESPEAAEHAAQQQHALALRAELLRAVVEEEHEELSFTGASDRNG